MQPSILAKAALQAGFASHASICVQQRASLHVSQRSVVPSVQPPSAAARSLAASRIVLGASAAADASFAAPPVPFDASDSSAPPDPDEPTAPAAPPVDPPAEALASSTAPPASELAPALPPAPDVPPVPNPVVELSPPHAIAANATQPETEMNCQARIIDLHRQGDRVNARIIPPSSTWRARYIAGCTMGVATRCTGPRPPTQHAMRARNALLP